MSQTGSRCGSLTGAYLGAPTGCFGCDGGVLIASTNQGLYGLDPASGSVLWIQSASRAHYTSVREPGGTLLLGRFAPNDIVRINPANGEVINLVSGITTGTIPPAAAPNGDIILPPTVRDHDDLTLKYSVSGLFASSVDSYGAIYGFDSAGFAKYTFNLTTKLWSFSEVGWNLGSIVAIHDRAGDAVYLISAENVGFGVNPRYRLLRLSLSGMLLAEGEISSGVDLAATRCSVGLNGLVGLGNNSNALYEGEGDDLDLVLHTGEGFQVFDASCELVNTWPTPETTPGFRANVASATSDAAGNWYVAHAPASNNYANPTITALTADLDIRWQVATGSFVQMVTLRVGER